MTTLQQLAADPEQRQEEIAEVLAEANDALLQREPRMLRLKFRKMAVEPFAFYRGSAALFYHDVARLEDSWTDERTRRVWIQGDLHAENFGTYMDSAGVLVFDVNDFDEAYLGHYTWDLRRMAASLALIGFTSALSDATIADLIRVYARSYLEQVGAFAAGDRDEDFRLTLSTTEGAVHALLQSARRGSRIELLDSLTTLDGDERRFHEGPGVRMLGDEEREEVIAAYERYLETIPEHKRQRSVSYRVKDVVGRSGFGIGSAGLPGFNLLVEGPSQALENDIVLSMKQGQIAAPSRVVRDPEITDYFEHPGHRTAVSQRALQAHADPWLGWSDLGGVGQAVKELSPYEADLDWESLGEPEEIRAVLDQLGRATAKVHCVSDESSEQTLVSFQTESAIMDCVGGDQDGFADDLAEFGAAYGAIAREDHRLFVDAFRNGGIPGLDAR